MLNIVRYALWDARQQAVSRPLAWRYILRIIHAYNFVIAFCLIVMSCKSTQVDEVLYQANQVDSAPKRVIRVTPAYPQNAWKEKTEGWVKILAVVDKSGKVEKFLICKLLNLNQKVSLNMKLNGLLVNGLLYPQF
jgi:hypothetical protein